MGKERSVITYDMRKKITDEEKRRKYTLFLKRKRLEQRKTQEDVAKGVCTVSYYSRIENNLVDIDEEYLVYLFKNLNIDFYSLKETRDSEVFKEILKSYLLSDLKMTEKILDDALKSAFYIDLEYNIMVLYYNIMKEDYKSARSSLIELDTQKGYFDENEMIFFLFLSALYAYRTRQGKIAESQIQKLLEIEIYDSVYLAAIYSLALDIFELTGVCGLFNKYYEEIKNNDFFALYPNIALLHKAQKISFELSDNNYDVIKSNLEEIKMNISESLQNEIIWILFKVSYLANDLKTSIDLINYLNLSGEVIASLGILALREEGTEEYLKFENALKEYHFKSFEQTFSKLCEICKATHLEQNYLESLSSMKQVITNQYEYDKNIFFYSIEIKLYLELSVKGGRYRDTVLSLLESLKRSNNYLALID